MAAYFVDFGLQVQLHINGNCITPEFPDARVIACGPGQVSQFDMYVRLPASIVYPPVDLHRGFEMLAGRVYISDIAVEYSDALMGLSLVGFISEALVERHCRVEMASSVVGAADFVVEKAKLAVAALFCG